MGQYRWALAHTTIAAPDEERVHSSDETDDKGSAQSSAFIGLTAVCIHNFM